MMRFLILCIIFLFSESVLPQSQTGFQIARLKYGGGGDWYNDPSAEVNLFEFYSVKYKYKSKSRIQIC
jgi:hypothetical protein